MTPVWWCDIKGPLCCPPLAQYGPSDYGEEVGILAAVSLSVVLSRSLPCSREAGWVVSGKVPGKPGKPNPDNRPSFYLGAVQALSALSQDSQNRLVALLIEHLWYASSQRKHYYPHFAEIWRLREARSQPGITRVRILNHI